MTLRNASNAAGGGCLWIILNALCLLFLGIGGWYGYRSWSLVQTGGSVTGTVVDIDKNTDDDGTSYAPIVEYTVDGDRYRMTGTYTNPQPLDIGDKVKLRYDQADPSVARIDSFVDLWLLPAIFIPLGLLFGLFYNAFVLFQWVRRLSSG